MVKSKIIDMSFCFKLRRFVLYAVVFFPVFAVYGYGQPSDTAGGHEKQTTVLMMSDIHFDPFVGGVAAELEKSPVSGWGDILKGRGPGKMPDYMEDTNYTLLSSAMDGAGLMSKDIDCVLIDGDMLCHNFDAKCTLAGFRKKRVSFAIKTMEFISMMIERALPGKIIYFVIGNNDSDNGDYNIIPGGKMLAELSGYYSFLKGDASAAADFSKGGYCRLPFASGKGTDLIMLNDIFWSKKFKPEKKAAVKNPGADEMKWLKSALKYDTVHGRKALIAMHIPAGTDAYLASRDKNCGHDDGFLLPEFNRQFLDLIKANSAVISCVFSGHTHFDDFRVFSDKGSPYMSESIIPSVSPSHGNNPAFELVLMESGARVRDKEVYYLSGFGGEGAKWALEYSFCTAYGCDAYSLAGLSRAAGSIQTDQETMQKYLLYYSVSNPMMLPLLLRNSREYGCALTSGDSAEFSDCACVPGKN